MKKYVSQKRADKLINRLIDYLSELKKMPELIQTLINCGFTYTNKMEEAMPKLYPEMEIKECTYTYTQLEATAKTLNDNSSKFPKAHLNVSIDVQQNWVELGTDNVSDDLRDFIDTLEFNGCVHFTEDELSLDVE